MTDEEAYQLFKWILDNQRKGLPKRKINVQLSMKELMDASERPNPFKDTTPGTYKVVSFLTVLHHFHLNHTIKTNIHRDKTRAYTRTDIETLK